MGKKKRNPSKRGVNRTPLNEHIRKGKELLPPFSKLSGILSTCSWKDDRLPEMIWAILIRTALSREEALNEYRRILNVIAKHPKAEYLHDLTITGISKIDGELGGQVISLILQQPKIAEALSVLRIFDRLPAKKMWHSLLPEIRPDLDLLMRAVGTNLWHQSQEATDVRWLRIMAQVVTGKLHAPKEILEEWFGYPDVGDQRKVRPSIRANEMIQDPLNPPDLTWSRSFWDNLWRISPCMGLAEATPSLICKVKVTKDRLDEIIANLFTHWKETSSTTSVDTKHDAVFGMAFYSLRILEELFRIGNGTTVLGRLGLRTIFEVHVTLRYLIGENNPELWQRWRRHGAGQAKLNALKFDDYIEPPKFIDIESIERIASEDIWEELLPIDLGNWCGLDLRRMSETVGLKETYDRYYSWTSGYVHGAWGPIRESCFSTCMNPLHRLHRYPEGKVLYDVVEDAAILVDEILKDLDTSFPTFPFRLTI